MNTLTTASRYYDRGIGVALALLIALIAGLALALGKKGRKQ